MVQELLGQQKQRRETRVDESGIEATYRTLERVLDSVASADNKALIGLTFQGAIVAGLILAAEALKSSNATRSITDPLTITILFFVLLFLFALCFSTIKLFQAITPRIAPPHSSAHVSELFYWAGIANMKPEEFQERMRHLEPDEIHEAVAHITYVNANIARAKFTNVRHAFQGLGIQLVLYVIVVMLSELPGMG